VIRQQVARRLGSASIRFRLGGGRVFANMPRCAFENDGRRDFDIGALKSLSDEAFRCEWRRRNAARENAPPQQRFFAEVDSLRTTISTVHRAGIPALRTRPRPGGRCG